MGDRLLIALVIFAVLVALAAAAMWALLAHTRRLDGKPKVCGADGPYGLQCTREPHDEPLHRSQGIEWWPS